MVFSKANQKKIRVGVLFTSLFVILALVWDSLTPLRNLEEQTLDFRYQYFNRNHSKPDDVFVVDIDEQSLALLKPALGAWPWPRAIYKDIIEFVSLTEPTGFFFDLMMLEPQLGTDNDKILTEAIVASQKTSFAMKLEEFSGLELEPGAQNPLPPEFAEKYFIPEIEGLKNFPVSTHYQDYSIPAADYIPAIPWIHSVNSPVDSDGVYRRVPLLLKYQNGWLPTLSLAAVFSRVAPGKKFPEDLNFKNSRLNFTGTDNKKYSLPLDSKGRIRVHFYNLDKDNGREPLAPILDSARALQSGEVDDPSKLKVDPTQYMQKIWMIGSSAATLGDLKTTPLTPTYPGVLIHSTVVSNILRADHLERISEFVRMPWALILIYLTAFCVLLGVNPVIRFGIPLGVIAAYVALALLQFKFANKWWDLASPLICFGGTFFTSLMYMIFVEGKEKKKIQETLGKYLPPSVISEMIANGSDLRAEIGKKTELSILFSDIRGFTTLSEKLPPEKVVAVLNSYLGRMTDVVFEHGGTLDKFIGDAIMCFWGAPVENRDHAFMATRCALSMIDHLAQLKKEWSQSATDPGVDLQIGIGINTGVVIVGNIGSEKKLDYTVIGDNVNLASRLEGLTKQYKSQLIIGERTRELLGDRILVRTADKVKVVGKNSAVKIFEPLCESTSANANQVRSLIAAYENAWSLYEQGQFAKARQGFENILKEGHPEDGLSKVYVERCQYFIDNPPQSGDWDGVFVAKSK